MMSLIWSKIVKVSPVPDNMFTQSELKVKVKVKVT